MNSFSVSSPATTTGTSGAIPAPAMCSAFSAEAFTVRMPTARPAGSMRCTSGTSMRLEVNTGMETAAAISGWNLARKPQLVVTARTPSRSRKRELGEEPAVGGDRAHALPLEEARALDEGGSSSRWPWRTTRSGEAPVTRW